MCGRLRRPSDQIWSANATGVLQTEYERVTIAWPSGTLNMRAVVSRTYRQIKVLANRSGDPLSRDRANGSSDTVSPTHAATELVLESHLVLDFVLAERRDDSARSEIVPVFEWRLLS